MPYPESAASSHRTDSRETDDRSSETDERETDSSRMDSGQRVDSGQTLDAAKPNHPRTPRLKLPAVDPDLPLDERLQQARYLAMEVFAQTGSWVVFFREMMGSKGVCAQLFPSPEERGYFETTEVYAELQEIIAGLRSQDSGKADAVEPEKMITIRLPASLHQALLEESKSLPLSLNKLCISKLLQRIDDRFIPDHHSGTAKAKSKFHKRSQTSSESFWNKPTR